jgi:hypothetical protein
VTEQTGRRRDAVHTAAPEGRPHRLDGGDVVEQMETGVVERIAAWRGKKGAALPGVGRWGDLTQWKTQGWGQLPTPDGLPNTHLFWPGDKS